MEKVLISYCLLGKNCKYNGKNNLQERLVKLQDKVEFIPVCSEELALLPTPRIPCEIKNDKVINEIGLDATDKFNFGANKVLQIAKENNVKYAIFKERSPSCGVHYIYNGNFEKKLIPGKGITTKLLEENGIKVFSDEEILKLLEKKG